MITRPLLAFAIVVATPVGPTLAGAETPPPCSEEWNRHVDRLVVSADGQGHGPDLGSNEWQGVVEFKLGVRDQPGLSARGSDDWCEFIDRLVNPP